MTANPKYEHLVNNLQRSESSDSLLNQIFQRKYSSSLAQWNLEKWLEELLPNTRLIIEPKIFGCGIAFCCYQILNSDLNHFESLQALKNLGFEIPETEFTHYTIDVYLCKKLWEK